MLVYSGRMGFAKHAAFISRKVQIQGFLTVSEVVPEATFFVKTALESRIL